MSILFSPLRIKNIPLRNRIVVSPMCQYSSPGDGFATDWHLVHLGSRAVGGAALVIQEATAVSAEGRITAFDLGIYQEQHIGKLRQVTDFIHSQGAVAGIQIAHAGRKGSHAVPWEGGKQVGQQLGGWTCVSSSAIPFTETEQAPQALDYAGIQKVIEDFKAAAGRAKNAGYKVLEIHAAHGYLIHQFLSPFCNIRGDEYGGSFENRIRILLEIVEAVQSVWPEDLPLFVRISASDWVDHGWDIDQSVKLSALLKEKGVDLMDCSSGGAVSHVRIPLNAGYQVPFSARIKKETGILTGAVGLITTCEQAEEILSKDQADLIFFGRELLRDPYFPFHAAEKFGQDIPWPSQYLRAKPN